MKFSTTSPSALGNVDLGAPVSPPVAKGLRLWPAAILLALLAVVRLGWLALDEIPPFLFPVIFFGPLVVYGFVLIWWLAASRAGLLDRVLALLLLAAAGGASFALADLTMKGMVFQFYPLPVAVAGFITTLLLLGHFNPKAATWAAVAVGAVCFSGATLVRSNGFTGNFRAEFDWRWNLSAEERYLAELKASKEVAKSAPRKELPEPGAVRWSGFRGPNRDGTIPGVRLAEDWNTQPPREVWRRKVGPAWSSFAVTDNLLYSQEQRDKDEAVVCYDARTGAEVWSYEYPSRFWEAIAGAGPRATPTLHEGGVYALGAQGILCRLDAKTGEMVWTRDLRKDAEREPPMWGFSCSPLVAEGCVIVHAGGSGDKGLLAYDLKTGSPRWGAPAGDHSYSSPQLSTVAGRPCILMLSNLGVRAHDPASGKTLWDHEWKFEGYRAVQPLVLGETGVLIGTMVGAGTQRIDVTREGDSPGVKERWTTQALKPGFNDYVAHKGHLYGFDTNIFACLDLETGKLKWKGGRYGSGQVVLLPDSDQLLVISEKGELVLLRANPDKLEEVARFRALENKTWNHPVLVGNRLFVRNAEEAACFELRLAN